MTNDNQYGSAAGTEPVVYVVDDDGAVRTSLQLLLKSAGHVCRAYPTAARFLADFDPGTPGCLLLDVRMPGMSGLDLQRKLAEDRVPLPVILVTGYGAIDMAVQSMRAGAVDFIEKPFNTENLLGRVQDCLALSTREFQRYRERKDARQRLERLTPREQQVLDRLVTGSMNKTIAHELGISRKTVDVHRTNIMHKVGARTFAGLVRCVLQTRDD